MEDEGSYCGYCGAEIPPNAEICPRCGKPAESPDLKKTAVGVANPMKGALLSEMAPPPWPDARPLTVLQPESSPPTVFAKPGGTPQAEAEPEAPPPEEPPEQDDEPAGDEEEPADLAEGTVPDIEPPPPAEPARPITEVPLDPGVVDLGKTSMGMPSGRTLGFPAPVAAAKVDTEPEEPAPSEPFLPPSSPPLRPPRVDSTPAVAAAFADVAEAQGPSQPQEAAPHLVEEEPHIADASAPAPYVSEPGEKAQFPHSYIEGVKYLFNMIMASRERGQRRDSLDRRRAVVESQRNEALVTLGTAAYAAGLEREDLLDATALIREADERHEDLTSRREAIDEEKVLREAELNQQEEDTRGALDTARSALSSLQAELNEQKNALKAAQRDAANARRKMDSEGKRILDAERKLMENPPDAQQLHAQIAESRKQANDAEEVLKAAEQKIAELEPPIAEKEAQTASLQTEVSTHSAKLGELANSRKTYEADVQGRLQEFTRRIEVEDGHRRDAALSLGQALVARRYDSDALTGAYEDVDTKESELQELESEHSALDEEESQVDDTKMMQGFIGVGMGFGAFVLVLLFISIIVQLVSD